MKHERICLIGCNTQNADLIDVTFQQTHLEKINRIMLEGAMFTGDKTTIQLDTVKYDLVGVFNWQCDVCDVKHIYIAANWGGVRVGLLTIYYEGEDEDKLKSKAVGASAALPTDLMSRM